MLLSVQAGLDRNGAQADQVRQNVTGGTAGPIISPMSRNSQFKSMPAALKMQDRAPVHGNREAQGIHTPGEAESDRWNRWANQDAHEEVQPIEINACHIEDA